jgi:hypothetical protein
MAKKSFTGDRTVKKKVLEPNIGKAEKPLGKASLKKQSMGEAKENGKPASGKGKTTSADIKSLKEQLAQRNDELAILNSVGEAMAKTLDVKTVAKIVGDKLREIFHA